MLFSACTIPCTTVDIDKIQDIVMQRYKCYSNDVEPNAISPQCDAVGHFMMCMIASKANYLRETILFGEQKLFEKKLKMLKTSELIHEVNCALKWLDSVQQITKHTSKSNKCKECIMRNVLMVLGQNAKHIFHSNHKGECQKIKLTVPFTLVPKAVAAREVEVVGGMAAVYCGQWVSLIESIFLHMQEFEMTHFRHFKKLHYIINEMEDSRLRDVISRAVDKMTGKIEMKNGSISFEEIDDEAQYFPPCMGNLHKILRRTHRLSYDSRYQYTLFLKDIGLPVKENILFWKNEYMKSSDSSCCSHDWMDNSSRYEYQIYHLYGLKGSHSVKTSHQCRKFTQNLTMKMNSGCPFAHLNRGDLIKLLEELSGLGVEDLSNFILTTDKPQRNCARYLECKKRSIPRERCRVDGTTVMEILSPVHYHKLARELSSPTN